MNTMVTNVNKYTHISILSINKGHELIYTVLVALNALKHTTTWT